MSETLGHTGRCVAVEEGDNGEETMVKASRVPSLSVNLEGQGATFNLLPNSTSSCGKLGSPRFCEDSPVDCSNLWNRKKPRLNKLPQKETWDQCLSICGWIVLAALLLFTPIKSSVVEVVDPLALPVFGDCDAHPCLVYLIDFHQNTTAGFSNQWKTLPGETFSFFPVPRLEPGWGSSSLAPVAAPVFGDCEHLKCHVHFVDFHPDTVYSVIQRRKTLFGKEFSSDVTGDGPKSARETKLDSGLAQLAGLDTSKPTYSSVAGAKQGRNKKVDHEKKVNGGRADPSDASERPAGKARVHPAKAREEKRAEEKKEEPVVKIVRPLMNTLGYEIGWDGKQAFKFQGGKAVGLTDGLVLDVVPENTMVPKVVKSAPGYLSTKSDGELTVRAVSAFEVIEFNTQFSFEGRTYLPRQYYVFKPFFTFLQTKVSTPNCTDTHRNMAFASANRHFGAFCEHDVFVMTYSYYVHYNMFRVWRMQTGFGKVVVEDRDRLIDSEMVRYGEVKMDGHIGRHGSMDCPLVDDYPFREDCVLVFKDANLAREPVYYSAHEVKPARPDTYPRFETSEPNANSSRYTRSIYTGFYPEDATPFVMYSVNAKNACKALKRMCGARQNSAFESNLSALQYASFSVIYKDSDLFWKGNDDDAWRSRFEAIANIEYLKGENSTRLYDNIQVGNVGKLEKLSFGRVRKFMPVKYKFPYRVVKGWVYDEVITDSGPILDWFSSNVCLSKIHNQMRLGFELLLGQFNYDNLDDYYHDHPDWIYGPNYVKHTTMVDYQESREELADVPHLKRLLRKWFVQKTIIHTPDDNMTKFVEAKVKKEFAKQGKAPRLYVTYDGGCMYANELPEYAKICLHGVRSFDHNGVHFDILIYAKPKTVELERCFNRLIRSMSGNNEVVILIYSDDSVWTGNVNGVEFAFNVDISSCDSGNKSGVFGLIFMLLSQFSPELAVGLVSQCSNVIKLKNPEDSDEECEIHMHSLFEGSGTVLTTILNHVAMYMIANAAVVLIGEMKQGLTHWEQISELIVKSGESFGHVLSVEPAKSHLGFIPEKIQFLKRSPLQLTNGKYIPVMNYGTIFRGFGSIEGDLTADMIGMSVVEFAQLGMEERGNVFLSGVVAGLKNEPTSIILSALRRRFSRLPGSLASGWENLDQNKFLLQSSNVHGSESPDHAGGMVSSESLCRRYDLDTSQLAALAGKINNCRVGHIYPDACVGSFARVDYGCGHV